MLNARWLNMVSLPCSISSKAHVIVRAWIRGLAGRTTAGRFAISRYQRLTWTWADKSTACHSLSWAGSPKKARSVARLRTRGRLTAGGLPASAVRCLECSLTDRGHLRGVTVQASRDPSAAALHVGTERLHVLPASREGTAGRWRGCIVRERRKKGFAFFTFQRLHDHGTD